jgi:hypothetical protein
MLAHVICLQPEQLADVRRGPERIAQGSASTSIGAAATSSPSTSTSRNDPI